MSAVLLPARCRRPNQPTETVRRNRRGSTIQAADALAATIHDLRTPLAVIAATAELLHDSVNQRGIDEDVFLIQRIQRNTSWLTALVDNLSAEIELSANRLTQNLSMVDLRQCLETPLAIAQTLLDQRHQHVHWECSDGVKVRGNRRQIEQVIINLLLNASKYGDPYSEIRIDVEAGGGRARIQIHNVGPIIPRGEQEQIFQPFVRGSNVDGTGPAGLGLGLHIVKTIVERHGGRVGVDSSPTHGTLVWFTLPTAD